MQLIDKQHLVTAATGIQHTHRSLAAPALGDHGHQRCDTDATGHQQRWSVPVTKRKVIAWRSNGHGFTHLQPVHEPGSTPTCELQPNAQQVVIGSGSHLLRSIEIDQRIVPPIGLPLRQMNRDLEVRPRFVGRKGSAIDGTAAESGFISKGLPGRGNRSEPVDGHARQVQVAAPEPGSAAHWPDTGVGRYGRWCHEAVRRPYGSP